MISRFSNPRSVRKIIMDHLKLTDHKTIERISSVEDLYILDKLKDKPWTTLEQIIGDLEECSMNLADLLREYSWGRLLFGVTMPAILEQIEVTTLQHRVRASP